MDIILDAGGLGLSRLTSFNLVSLCVIPYIGSLWLRDLHLAILLCLRQGKVLLIPLQTIEESER